MNLGGLMDRLCEELPRKPEKGAPIDEGTRRRVEDFLQKLRLNPREWQQHTVHRRSRYTRSIVGYSPGQYVALLLCWAPGQQSPIHDHSGAHCFVKMLSGQLVEERFDWEESGGAGQRVTASKLDASQPETSVAFMHDTMGLHRISNPSSEEPAVSLHIYAPPFETCQVFPPTGAAPKVASMVSAFSSPFPAPASFLPRKSLREFCGALALEERVDAVAVLNAVDALSFDALEHARYSSAAHFSEFGVVSSLAHLDDKFSVVVSCWSPGQKLQPQLGGDRKMWLKVMHGSMGLKRQSGDAVFAGDASQSMELHEGSVTILADGADQRVSMSNLDSGEHAVTVQVYSPPLTQFAFQTSEGVVRKDIPRLAGALHAPASAPANGRTRAARLANVRGNAFLSLQELNDLLSEELLSAEPSMKVISRLLRRSALNPDEWRLRVSQWRGAAESPGLEPHVVPLATSEAHTLALVYWSRGRKCDGTVLSGRPNWTLVLEGELEEEIYADGERESSFPLRASTLQAGSLTFNAADVVAQRCCDGDVPCVSLHLICGPW